jgi:hypothetical protein
MTFKKGEVNYHRNGDADVLEREGDDPRPAPIVARFQLADVPARGAWLLKRLAQRWPHISEATLAGRLRAWIGSNSHHLIKGANGVALFRLIRSELDLMPFVEEVFLFTQEPKTTSSPSERDAVALYQEAARWSRNLGATRVIIGRASDHSGVRMVKLLDAAEDIERSIIL